MLYFMLVTIKILFICVQKFVISYFTFSPKQTWPDAFISLIWILYAKNNIWSGIYIWSQDI